MKKKIDDNIYVGTMCLIASVYFYNMSLSFRGSAGLMPRFLFPLIMILSGLMILNGIGTSLKWRKNPESAPDRVPPSTYLMPVLYCVITFTYLFAIPRLGFFVSTGLLMVGSIIFLGMRSIKTISITTAGVLIFIYAVFVLQLSVRFPRGMFY